jgi:sulfite exporter TauE/SafE
MIELLGWVSTSLVLIGYICNANRLVTYAMISWIIGDIGWVIYDLYIDNISHLVLSFVIISINLYGMYNIKKTEKE